MRSTHLPLRYPHLSGGGLYESSLLSERTVIGQHNLFYHCGLQLRRGTYNKTQSICHYFLSDEIPVNNDLQLQKHDQIRLVDAQDEIMESQIKSLSSGNVTMKHHSKMKYKGHKYSGFSGTKPLTELLPMLQSVRRVDSSLVLVVVQKCVMSARRRAQCASGPKNAKKRREDDVLLIAQGDPIQNHNEELLRGVHSNVTQLATDRADFSSVHTQEMIAHTMSHLGDCSTLTALLLTTFGRSAPNKFNSRNARWSP